MRILISALGACLMLVVHARGASTAIRHDAIQPFLVDGKIACTAFSVSERRRLWITAAHCTPDGVAFSIGAAVGAALIARDPDLDLAALQGGPPAHALNISRGHTSEGAVVSAVGYSGDTQRLDVGFRVVSPIYLWQDETIPVLVLQAPVWPGLSGSPVFDGRGHVVSVLQGTLTRHGVLMSYGPTTDNVRAFLLTLGKR